MNKTSAYLHTESLYEAGRNVWSIRKGDDLVWGLDLRISNMFTDYPFEAMDLRWEDTERLYLCGQFSGGTPEEKEVQEKIRTFASPLEAKLWAKKEHKQLIRPDFEEFRVEWMLWVVWQKAKGNADFRKALLDVPDNVQLIENTGMEQGGTGDVWGCKNPELMKVREELRNKLEQEYAGMAEAEKAEKIGQALNSLSGTGQWRGRNGMGKILGLIRECLKKGTEPEIDYDLLKSKNIHIGDSANAVG